MNKLKILILTLLTMIGIVGCAPKQQDDSQVVLKTIFSRKSVRSYTDEPVSPEQVETLLKAAMAAPSGRNLQAWRFVVVREQAVKEKLAVGFNKMIAKAPVAIVVCGQVTNDGHTASLPSAILPVMTSRRTNGSRRISITTSGSGLTKW